MSENPDSALSVKFFIKPTENKRKSKEAGRPIFDEVEMVTIVAPANRKSEHTARADRMHWDGNRREQISYIDRFPEHYRQFKAGLEQQGSGTPISMLHTLSEAAKAELIASKIVTVEQLAGVSDRDVGKKGAGFRAYVDAARAYLAASSGGAQMAAEMAELRAEIERLKAAKGETAAPALAVPDQWEGYDDDDLRNMLRDAGQEIDGRWGRAKLIEKLAELAKEAA